MPVRCALMKTPSFVVLALLVAAAAHGQPAAAELTRGIREFVARDWAAVRESKDAYRGGPYRPSRTAGGLSRWRSAPPAGAAEARTQRFDRKTVTMPHTRTHDCRTRAFTPYLG